MPNLTLRELIEKLSEVPEPYLDNPVILEGCDCSNPCSGVDMYENWEGKPTVRLEINIFGD